MIPSSLPFSVDDFHGRLLQSVLPEVHALSLPEFVKEERASLQPKMDLPSSFPLSSFTALAAERKRVNRWVRYCSGKERKEMRKRACSSTRACVPLEVLFITHTRRTVRTVLLDVGTITTLNR